MRPLFFRRTMKQFCLIRMAYTREGTFGVLLEEDNPFCLTLERQWADNQPGESCIPVGEYTCRRRLSPKFGVTFEVMDVPGRTNILFHKGNLKEDSHGCIILGEQYEPLNGQSGVVASGKAMEEFLTRTYGLDEFRLSVMNARENPA